MCISAEEKVGVAAPSGIMQNLRSTKIRKRLLLLSIDMIVLLYGVPVRCHQNI